MLWFYLTILAYLFNAFAFILDKYLLVNYNPRPFAYAFWVAILSTFAVALIPFGVVAPGAGYLLIAIISGSAFFIGLIFLYKSMQITDISVATTMSGVATAAFSYFLAVPVLGEPSGVFNSAAIILLIGGTLFLGRTDRKIWFLAIAAGIFFSVSFVFLKISFNLSDFANGFFWTRVGFVGTALVSLISASFRNDVRQSFRGANIKTGSLFISAKILAAAGFILLYYSIQLGEVSVVNSLLGFQFLFIFILALLFRRIIPHVEENIDRRYIINKIVGICLVVAGFLLILIL
ncbi:MAG: hypothetical protein AAB461_02100 [Patescibacteria group bacterium]